MNDLAIKSLLAAELLTMINETNETKEIEIDCRGWWLVYLSDADIDVEFQPIGCFSLRDDAEVYAQQLNDGYIAPIYFLKQIKEKVPFSK